jgi:cytochrome c oxidase cbb3-type subunit 4
MIEHALMVLFSKSMGVVYFFLFFVAVVIYAYLPRNKQSFSEAASSILKDNDKPCQ